MLFPFPLQMIVIVAETPETPGHLYAGTRDETTRQTESSLTEGGA